MDNYFKNILFGYLTCLRLLPNYRYFFKNYSFGDPSILSHYLMKVRNLLIHQDISDDFGNFRMVIDHLTPTPDQFDSVLASSALDCCSAIFELLSYIKDKKNERIHNIATAATDSVDMFIQVEEKLDINEDGFEEKIYNNPLMIREKKIQKEIWDYLNLLDLIKEDDIVVLEKKQFNNGMGNLDLKEK